MKKQLLIIFNVLFAVLFLNAQDQTINGATFKQDGSVGIGTSTPNEKFQIGDAFAFHDGGHKVLSFLYGPTGSVDLSNSHYAGEVRFDPVLGNLRFGTSSSVTSLPTTRFTINNNGNIGIGTTNPSYKLDVLGDVAFSNSSYLRTKNSSSLNTRIHGINSSNIEYIGAIDQNIAGTMIGTTTDYLNFRTNSISALFIDANQDVGIGTTDTQGFKLGVDGKIAATEVKVATYNSWSDFVFNKDYELPTLKEVEQHIKQKGHLENIPSAEEVKEDGFYLAEMNAKLLQKIEELTLYTIEQEKQLEAQNSKIDKLEKENKELKILSERVAKIEALLNNQKR